MIITFYKLGRTVLYISSYITGVGVGGYTALITSSNMIRVRGSWYIDILKEFIRGSIV